MACASCRRGRRLLERRCGEGGQSVSPARACGSHRTTPASGTRPRLSVIHNRCVLYTVAPALYRAGAQATLGGPGSAGALQVTGERPSTAGVNRYGCGYAHKTGTVVSRAEENGLMSTQNVADHLLGRLREWG